MAKGITDMQDAIGMRRERNTDKKIEVDNMQEEKEREHDEETTKKQTEEPAFPIPATDKFYTFIGNSPQVSPSDMRVYPVKN